MCTTPTVQCVHTSALVNTNKLFEYAQKASVRTLGVHLYQQYLNTFNPKWRKKTSWLATPDTWEEFYSLPWTGLLGRRPPGWPASPDSSCGPSSWKKCFIHSRYNTHKTSEREKWGENPNCRKRKITRSPVKYILYCNRFPSRSYEMLLIEEFFSAREGQI